MVELYTKNYEFIKEIKFESEIPHNFTGIVEYADGDKAWFNDGKIHHVGGPAYFCRDGRAYYYVDSNEISKKEHDLLADIMKLKALL